ncbi:MAG: Eco57I restriction-modification methylase domain-containing protein, partial [Lentimicrobiaceae bacterium]|nr:Eco57I restriction-modification methylase domain-containing protein [Lentimicrobiaceae bacterium]
SLLDGIEKDILENNLYGVDINEESVEIAKLALWLRTAKPHRKLNSLNDNIKCGNSLIDDVGVAGEKAFDWKKEFPQVFERGGFDVVIGNPPYVLCQPSNTPDNILNYYKQFDVASYKIDLFHLFFEQGIKLLKQNGKLGYITPNTYLTNKYIKLLRKFILNSTTIDYLVQHEDNVFADASVDVATIILSKQKKTGNSIILQKNKNSSFETIGTKEQNEWNSDIDYVFNMNADFKADFSDCVALNEICNTYFGIQAFDRKSSISETKKDEQYLEIIDGGDIFSFSYSIPNKYFNYTERNIKSGGDWNVYKQERLVVRQIGQIPIVGMCKKNVLASNTLYSIYPKIEDYELKYILCLLNSSVIKNYWSAKYSDNKILFPKIKGYQLKELPIKAISKEKQQPFIDLADKMLNLNADLQTKRRRFLKRLSDNFANIKITVALERFHELYFKDFVAELKKQKITLSLKQQDEWEEYFGEYKAECTELAEKIDSTDKEIDGMVYGLYGLSAEEIEVIENK